LLAKSADREVKVTGAGTEVSALAPHFQQYWCAS
jgi:hypothetical protein